MGYNTVGIFLNDGIDLLKSDPEAGRKLYDGIITSPRQRDRATDVAIGNHMNMASFLPSEHADDVQVVAVGGNCLLRLGTLYGQWATMREPEKLLKALADQMGYRIVKRATK